MTKTNNQSQALFEEMAGIKRAMHSASAHLLSEYNLTRPQIEIIFVIAHQSRQTIGGLAHAMGVTNGAATQMIEVMVKRGIVERHPDKTDRRVIHVVLSATGKQLSLELRKRHGAFMTELLAGFASAELAQLVELMRKVHQQIEYNQREGRC